jgi:hypothetical protein
MASGCARQVTTETLSIQKVPAPEIIAEDGKARVLPAGFIKRRLRLGMPSIKNVAINDHQYVYITEKWFLEVMNWTENFIALQAPDLNLDKHQPIAYDVTFSSLAANIANIAVARRYDLKASVLIGLIKAKNTNPWGRIPGDGDSRVYVIALTEHDGIVYDIHTKQTVLFSKFPNFDSIHSIMF